MNIARETAALWAWEARAERKDLVAEYANKYPITRRRWRVEGTRVGHSRLLTHEKAQLTCARYGGRVVQIVPFTPLAERQALNLKACPLCKAKASKPCKSKHGRVVTPHVARWELEA